jgi:hypothetical protein
MRLQDQFMPTTTISQAEFIEAAPAVVSISENSIPQNIPHGMEYAAFVGNTWQVYNQLDRNPQNQRWICTDNSGQISTDQLLQHLQGDVTLSTYFQQKRQVTLVATDDDHGGIDAAQAAVNRLLDHGLVAFAVHHQSVNFDGTHHHNGSQLFLKLNDTVLVNEAKAAMYALLKGIFWLKDGVELPRPEISDKCRLPFGIHKWAVNPYGTLVLPYAEPIALVDSGQHGLSILAEQGILETRNDADHFLEFMPVAAPPVATAIPASTSKTIMRGKNGDVVRAYNERYTAAESLQNCDFYLTGPHNARCWCNKHDHNDMTASIGIDHKQNLIYFNAPACDFHNDGRPYTAFSLMQYAKFGGRSGFIAALDEARLDLNMPFKVIKAKVQSPVRLPQAAPVELHQNAIKAIAKDYKVYSEKLTAQQRQVLRIIFDKARNTGYAPIKWGSLSKLAGVHENTCKYAVKKFVKDGMLVKFTDSTDENLPMACVFQIVSPSVDLAMTDEKFVCLPVPSQIEHAERENDSGLSVSLLLKKEIDSNPIPAESESTSTSSDDTSAAPVSFFNSPSSDLPPTSVAPAPAPIVETAPTQQLQSATENAPAAPGAPELVYTGNCPAQLIRDGLNPAAQRVWLEIQANDQRLASLGASGITSPAYQAMAQAAPERPQAHQNRLTL